MSNRKGQHWARLRVELRPKGSSVVLYTSTPSLGRIVLSDVLMPRTIASRMANAIMKCLQNVRMDP